MPAWILLFLVIIPNSKMHLVVAVMQVKNFEFFTAWADDTGKDIADKQLDYLRKKRQATKISKQREI